MITMKKSIILGQYDIYINLIIKYLKIIKPIEFTHKRIFIWDTLVYCVIVLSRDRSAQSLYRLPSFYKYLRGKR